MDKLIPSISQLAEQIDLEKRFQWNSWVKDFKENNLFSEFEKEHVLQNETVFRQELALKKVLNQRFKTKVDTELAFWYIQKWGGISFKENDVNKNKVNSAIQKASQVSYLTTLDCISSLSKVTSVVNLENQVIYDSRVIYTLNWLILKHGGMDEKFFPIPEGRSSIASNFDISPLINFKFHKRFEAKNLYFTPKEAYQVFCERIKTINAVIYSDFKKEPFRLEMLLFTAFSIEIFNDIKKCLRIDIQNL